MKNKPTYKLETRNQQPLKTQGTVNSEVKVYYLTPDELQTYRNQKPYESSYTTDNHRPRGGGAA